MTVSDIIKGLLSMTGKKQTDLAEVLGMSSKQAMSNKVRMNRWSADDLIKAAELCGGKVAIIMPDGQTIQLRNDEDEKARTNKRPGRGEMLTFCGSCSPFSGFAGPLLLCAPHSAHK